MIFRPKKEKIIDRAQKYILKGYIDRAIEEYKKASAIDPGDTSIRLRIGELYIKNGMKEEAIKEYTEVAKSNAQKGFYLKAIAVYKQILKIDDSIIDVHYKLAELYTRQRLIADAISEYGYIVNVMEKRHRMDEVINLLKKMIEIDPANVGVRLKLADIYRKQGFDKDAFAEYRHAFERLLEQNKLDKAEKIYLDLYSSGIEEPEILEGLSELYKKKGDKERFVEFAKPLLAYYKEKNITDKARELYRAIIEIDPSYREDGDFLEEEEGTTPQEETPEAEEPLIEFPEVDLELPPGEEEGQETEQKEEIHQASQEPPLWLEESIEVEGFEPAEEVSAPPREDSILDLTDEAEVIEEVEPVEQAEAGKEVEEVGESYEEVEIELEGAEEELRFEEEVGGEVSEETKVGEVVTEAGGVGEVEPVDTMAEGMEERIGPEELVESLPEEMGEEEPREKEEYVDLIAELGMEETLEGIADSWAENETADTAEEFRNGIGKQLSREDTETHYNLGIAYMEMELYNEAAREFKIALKDPGLEFDCYTRLGLCAMAEGRPHEAIEYYLKGLQVKGHSEEERKGLNYELGLAYQAAGKVDEAREVFTSIYNIDPEYREVADKVKELSRKEEKIPLDDDLVEIEIL